MVTNSLLSTYIGPSMQARADAMLTTAPLGDQATHDAWFRARVQEALDDSRLPLSDKQVEAQFAERRARALAKSKPA